MNPEPPHEPHEPEAPRGRRIPMVLVGAGVALLAGGAIAWTLLSGDHGPTAPPPASEGGLVIDAGGGEDGRIDPARPLRCFVAGRYVGELTLTDCARRNGVATDALDVGIDQTGALAADQATGPTLIPLPPQDVQPIGPPESALPPPDAAERIRETPPPAPCLRHSARRWQRLGEMDLNACVQTLFAGRCERPGAASYGRWGGQTLRLVTGRVEISDDNQSFRPLAPQGRDCSLPPVG